jgi:GNAT superfamily N-acetyltransferase
MQTSIVVRTIATSERDAVLDLLADWLNDRDFFARYFAYDPSFRDDLCFVAEDGGRIVSTMQVFRKLVRIDGATLAVGCVGNVYTAPAYRQAGVASSLLERSLAAMDRHGFDVSLLFATRLDFYARFGWRSQLRYLSFIEPCAAQPATDAEDFVPARDLDGVTHVYGVHSAPIPGSTVRDAPYWNGQLRYAGNPDERFRIVRRGGAVVAYARATTLYDFHTIIEHGCLPGAEPALADLIAQMHAGSPTGTIAQLTPSADLEELLRGHGLTVNRVEDRSWMWHALDAARLATKLRVPEATVRSEGFFEELLPALSSRYWLSDRF